LTARSDPPQDVRRTRRTGAWVAAVAVDGVGALHRRTYRRAPAGPTTRAVGREAVQCAARRPVGHLLNAGADRPGGRCVELYAARPYVIRTCLPPRCSFRSYRVMSCLPMLSRGRVAPSPPAQVHRLEVSGPGLIDCQGVTHADGVAFPQSLRFLDDSAVKIRMPESEHTQLDRSDCHVCYLPSTYTRRMPRGGAAADQPCAQPHHADCGVPHPGRVKAASAPSAGTAWHSGPHCHGRRRILSRSY